jgi:hypothetical protein
MSTFSSGNFVSEALKWGDLSHLSYQFLKKQVKDKVYPINSHKDTDEE